MAAENLSPQQIERLLAVAGRRLGTTPEQLRQAFQNGGLAGISDLLSAEEATRAENLLKDRQRVQELLATPGMQQLLQQLLGEG